MVIFSSRSRHTRCGRDWSSDVCSSDLYPSGQQFVDGMNPAVTIGAVLVAIGAIAAFAIKRSSLTACAEMGADASLLAACACASCWCAQPGDCVDSNDEDGSPGDRDASPQVPVPV